MRDDYARGIAPVVKKSDNWLDIRLAHTLKRGAEWIAGSKPNVADLKDNATAAMADLLAAQQGQKGKVPVVRLPNGDFIWGSPYQAAPVDTEIPKEVLERYEHERNQYQHQDRTRQAQAQASLGLLGGIGGSIGRAGGGYGFNQW